MYGRCASRKGVRQCTRDVSAPPSLSTDVIDVFDTYHGRLLGLADEHAVGKGNKTADGTHLWCGDGGGSRRRRLEPVVTWLMWVIASQPYRGWTTRFEKNLMFELSCRNLLKIYFQFSF